MVPAHETKKQPKGKWEKYQKEMYPLELLEKYEGKVGTITGAISNNLWGFDLDFKKGYKHRFTEIWDNFKEEYPKLANSYIEESPHGFHPFYYIIDFEIESKITKNAGYYRKSSGKNIGELYFEDTTKTKYAEYLKGVDCRGEGGFMITAPSQYNSKVYKAYNNSEVLTITKEEYEKIMNFFLLEKPKRIRRQWVNILNGKIKIHEQIKLAVEKFNEDIHPKGEKEPKEVALWKGLYIECIFNGIKPEELFEGLEHFQDSFDIEKTKEQIPFIWKAINEKEVKPFNSDTMNKYFPQLKVKKKIEKKVKEKAPRKIKILTPGEIEKVIKFLNLPTKKKYQFLEEIINFLVAGEKTTRQIKLIFFLLLGNIFRRELISKIDLHGDPSAGKNYGADVAVSFIPNENRMILTNVSEKALFFDKEFDDHIKFIYFKEINKSSKNLIEVQKALYDGDLHYLVTNFENLDADHLHKKRTGLLNTYSFEYTSRDANERSWVLTPDQSIEQNKIVMNYRFNRRTDRIVYDLKETRYNRKIEFFKNVIRYIRDQPKYIVMIPKSKDLIKIFRDNELRVRRDIDKLPDLIEIITIFNQKQRRELEFGGRNYLFAEYEDLEYALTIGLDYFLEISQNVDDKQIAILNCMEYTIYNNLTQKNEERWYTVREVHEILLVEMSIHENTVRAKLTSLSANTYVAIKQNKKGKAYLYRKLKDYEESTFSLESLKEDITSMIERQWSHFENKTTEMFEREFEEEDEFKEFI